MVDSIVKRLDGSLLERSIAFVFALLGLFVTISVFALRTFFIRNHFIRSLHDKEPAC